MLANSSRKNFTTCAANNELELGSCPSRFVKKFCFLPTVLLSSAAADLMRRIGISNGLSRELSIYRLCGEKSISSLFQWHKRLKPGRVSNGM